MNQIILYVVDDEKNIRENLLQFIDWTSLGVTSVIAAKNGVDALEKMSVTPPDIVLTDVKMPKMNGIELAEQVRTRYPNCVLLFLSGFDDKEYLMSAIRLEAYQYIEKPIAIEDLSNHIANAVKKKLTSRNTYLHNQQLENFRSQNMQTVKSAALNEILTLGTSPSRFTATASVSNYHIFCIYFSNVNLDSPTKESGFFQLGKSLGSYFEDMGIAGFYKESYFFLIVPEDAPSHYEAYFDAEYVQKKLAPYRFSITALPHIAANADYAAIAQQLMDFAAHLRFYNIKYQKFLPTTVLSDFTNQEYFLEKLEEMIVQKKLSDVISSLDTLKTSLERSKYRVASVKEFTAKAYQLLRKYYDIEQNALDKDSYLFFDTASSLSDIYTYILELLQSLSTGHIENVTDGRIQQIIKYIEDNLTESRLSVGMVADHFSLSDNYLSTYFKNETTIPLNQYIIQRRIERSKKLLTDTNDKIQEVARQSGFSDTNYFSSVFKKHTGQTPLAYRKGPST